MSDELTDKGQPPYERILALPTELKTLTDGGGRCIEGMASTDAVDYAKEIVRPEAIADGLDTYMKYPILSYLHDWKQPIGKVEKAEVKDNGLWIRGRLLDPGDPLADAVWRRVEQGVIAALSIGFQGQKAYGKGAGHHDKDLGAWVWDKVLLREIALTPLGANPEANFQVAKSLGLDLALPEEGTSDHPDPEIRKMQTEEQRFIDDLGRLKGATTAVSNIVRHWKEKEGRQLSAEYFEIVTGAHQALGALLQPDADAEGGETLFPFDRPETEALIH